MTPRNFTSLVLIYAILISLFAPFAANAQRRIAPQKFNMKASDTTENGLQFKVREGSPQTEKREVSTFVAGEKLNQNETDSILKRLPQVKAQVDDKADFKLRPNSLPPPKTGNIISAKFPANEQRNAPNVENANSKTLEVSRFSPNGNVPIVSDLSVTFSQPMIAVTSQTQAAQSVPVQLTPNVKGQWRWLGTKTLIFDAATRFPMATRFVATIPAGTKSAVGGTLAKETTWTFSTPPPKVESFNLNGQTVKRDALIFASFDQEIDANAVLSKISATAKGAKIALRVANQDEIASDANISNAIKDLQPKRFIVFRAAGLLPQDSAINVSFEKGLPSAEGSLTTTEAQSFAFKTYGALKFVKSFCNNGTSEQCEPYGDFQLEFNNPIDATSFDKSFVKVEPNDENLKINIYGNLLHVSGYKKPRTTYKVTVSGQLKDAFGQTLGQDVSATFKVGAAGTNLSAQGESFITLDPNAKPNFSVYSTNKDSLRVRLYQVAPQDFSAYKSFQQGFYDKSKVKTPAFGKLVSDKVLQLKSNADETTETLIDLNAALKNGFGNVVLIVESTTKTIANDYENRAILRWLNSTQIGLTAFVDNENLSAFATALKDGKPANDVQISILKGGNVATNESGFAVLPLPETNKNGLLIAQRGDDVAILPENTNYYDDNSNWYKKSDLDSLRWFVFDDRKIYRPNEEVSIKGYLRKITGGKFADVVELGDSLRGGLTYVLNDSQSNEVLKGKANVNAFGAFDFKIKLPANVNLGYQNLALTTVFNSVSTEFDHNFQVQEFRRPEFEVSANVESSAPFFVGDSATINVEAKYFSGGFLANAKTNWSLDAKPTNYTPPNRDDFTFGKFVPWWIDYNGNDYENTTSQQFEGVTGADGKHRIAVDFVSANPARPYTLSANASVQDVNRQTFAANTSLLVHPSEIYVGIRTPKTFVRQGESFKVETISTNIDGKAVANRDVKINAVLKDYEQIKGVWQQIEVDNQTCNIKSTETTVSCDFTAKKGGVYTITATVLDDRERRNESELTLWVAGGKTEPKRDVAKEDLTLIPDKKDYAPNDVAEILVNSPFFPAEGVLTLRRDGIVKTERFTMNDSSFVLRVPIEERYLPNIHAQIDLVGASDRTDDNGDVDKKLPKRPAFASGDLNLSISTASRKLNVTAEPLEKTLEPAGTTKINVAVTDANNNAVANSEVAVIVVDESVLALTNYNITNPLAAFYQQIEAGTSDFHSRENVLLANPKDMLIQSASGMGNGRAMSTISGGVVTMRSEMAMPAPMAMERRAMKSAIGAGFIVDGQEITNATTGLLNSNNDLPIEIRQNFDALATFSPSVRTDANGKAVVDVKLPDNLTRYRVTAVAVDTAKRFGKGESAITAKQPLQIRPSAPRFMNFGDKIELPVVIQNQTETAMTVNVAVRATNAVLTQGGGKQVTIAANDRAEIRFAVTTENAGTARFQIGATAGKFADAAEIELPIYTPATTEAFATYGTTDANGAIVQPIETPTDVYTQFGGLEITTSSTQLQELTDAFIYLQNYPFECSEQISSRVLSVAALRDVLKAFDAKDLPSQDAIKAKMTSDIKRLSELQHDDGGFSFWRNDDESFPYLSVHVAHALIRAKQKGYEVPKNVLDKSKAYLKKIETKYPKWYSEESKHAISAYALYVRDLMSDNDAPKAKKLLATAGIDKLSLESLGWLMSVLAKDTDTIQLLKTKIINSATETAGAAHFVTNYTDGQYVLLSSDRRADAVILEALLKVDAQNDLIPKIVRGLLANKTKGRWENTQENVFVLLALDKYFQTYEKVTPNFVAKVWLGNAYAGEQKFVGRSVDSNLTNVPMNYLSQQKTSNLILDKQGDGRLYYRIGLNYAPKSLKLDAADYGFQVLRTYEAVDDAKDVIQNADGTWTIKSGARVRVKISMIAPTRRYHVALVDNLPAGFEIINTDLANAEAVPIDNADNAQPFTNDYYKRYYSRNWFEHQNLRDNRAEAFTSLLYDGVYNYSYVARATTPGNFVTPPAKAEEMYAPETFGRSSTDFVNIK